jgi:hypothetical protein
MGILKGWIPDERTFLVLHVGAEAPASEGGEKPGAKAGLAVPRGKLIYLFLR